MKCSFMQNKIFKKPSWFRWKMHHHKAENKLTVFFRDVFKQECHCKEKIYIYLTEYDAL